MAPLMMGQMALQGGQQLNSSAGGVLSGISNLVNAPKQLSLQRYEFNEQYQEQLKMLQSKNDQQQLQNYMSGLEQFASGSNQNSQFNATSNGSALADVQWQSLMNEVSAINGMQQRGASSRDLRQYTARNSFLDLNSRAQTGAQQEESFVDSLQRNRAQALELLRQSRDAFDYKYATGMQEENRKLRSSDISLKLQRTRADTERDSSGISLESQRTRADTERDSSGISLQLQRSRADTEISANNFKQGVYSQLSSLYNLISPKIKQMVHPVRMTRLRPSTVTPKRLASLTRSTPTKTPANQYPAPTPANQYPTPTPAYKITPTTSKPSVLSPHHTTSSLPPHRCFTTMKIHHLVYQDVVHDYDKIVHSTKPQTSGSWELF